MNKRNVAKCGAAALKVIALVLGISKLPELQELLGEKASWAALLFTGASAAKDVVITVMDAVDDGRINGSVVRALMIGAFLTIGFGSLASCAGSGVVNGVAVQPAGSQVIQFQPIPSTDIGEAPQSATLLLHSQILEAVEVIDSGK